MKDQRVNDMSALAYIEQAREWTTRLEASEVEKGNADNLREARVIVARDVGAAPGTLENLRNRRLKGIAAHLYDRLRARVLRELEAEMRALSHEIQILKIIGTDPRSSEMEAAEASLADVREALGLPPNGGGA